MTGEVTLRGRVLAIGGLKEKTLAAYAAGVKTVLIPKDNYPDLDEIDAQARENLHFEFCADMREVLSHALVEKTIDFPTTEVAKADIACQPILSTPAKSPAASIGAV